MVGGGLVGLWSALRLAQAGYDVAIYERGGVAGEASWAGGGILCPLWPWRTPDAVWGLALAGARGWRDALTASGDAERAGLIRSGMRVFDDTDGATAWARQAGVACTVYDNGVLLPDIDQVRTPRAARVVAAWAEANGVEIHTDCGELRLVQDASNQVRLLCQARTIEADCIVVAAGAWTDRVLAGIGASFGVTPVRGQMLALHAPGHGVTAITLAGGHYLIPRSNDLVLVGSTVEYAGFDARTTADARERLLSAACSIMPGLADATVAHHWAGLRPGTKDGIPFIGPVAGRSDVWVNAGHHRNGVVMAPAAAEALVRQMQVTVVATSY